MGLRFTWDAQKALLNLRKHGVSFAEASSAFADPLSITILDPDRSPGDARFILIGCSRAHRLLIVVHAEQRESDIRLISARLASRPERQAYEEKDG